MTPQLTLQTLPEPPDDILAIALIKYIFGKTSMLNVRFWLLDNFPERHDEIPSYDELMDIRQEFLKYLENDPLLPETARDESLARVLAIQVLEGWQENAQPKRKAYIPPGINPEGTEDKLILDILSGYIIKNPNVTAQALWRIMLYDFPKWTDKLVYPAFEAMIEGMRAEIKAQKDTAPGSKK